MKLSITALLLAFLLAAGPAAALTAQEVIELKKAGVSEETIQKMIEQERQGTASNSPVAETKDEMVYQAGEDAAARAEENRRHERWKEKKSLDATGNVIIDLRQ
jgi:DNA-binding transcriptional MerR regulator